MQHAVKGGVERKGLRRLGWKLSSILKKLVGITTLEGKVRIRLPGQFTVDHRSQIFVHVEVTRASLPIVSPKTSDGSLRFLKHCDECGRWGCPADDGKSHRTGSDISMFA